MNYAPKILTYLGEGNHFSQVLLVAGAPPVEKAGGKLTIVISVVLTPDDIRDTLAFFASHARRTGPIDSSAHGVFAFGIPKIGRFKVRYLTQRGSILVSIQRMPHDIPDLDTLLGEPAQRALLEVALNEPGGIVIFTGPSTDLLARLLYAAIDQVNQSRSRVLYILEQNLTYLLRHRNSIVIQMEVGTDVVSLEEGIQYSLHVDPDLLYVRDPRTSEDFAGLMCVAETGTLVVISMVSADDEHLASDLASRVTAQTDTLNRLLCKGVRATPDAAGRIMLCEAPRPHLRS